MGKQYAICEILGGGDFTFLIEYKTTLKRNKDYYGSCECLAQGFEPDKYEEVIIGRDIITGTPVKSMLITKRAEDIDEAARKQIIKNGKLLISKYQNVSESLMIDYLKDMSECGIKEYVREIENLKHYYLKAMKEDKKRLNRVKMIEKFGNYNLKIEKERIKRLVKDFKK